MTNKNKLLLKELITIDNLEIINKNSDLKRLSRDFFNYSPILTKLLDGCIADIVVRPKSIEAVIAVARKCWEFSIPLTIRGSGTGNYGQAVPLHGGVVMQMNYMNKVEKFFQETGFVKVQTGCLMGDLNQNLSQKNRELRLFPSTWRTATIGGFVSGGSGGIGSVKWGFLRDPGNLIGLEAITMEENPKLMTFDAKESEPLNHAYGTNGIITSLIISTDIKHNWHSLVIDCKNLEKAIEILKRITAAAINLRLGTILEESIVEQISSSLISANKCNKLLIQSTPCGINTIQLICSQFNSEMLVLGEEKNLNNEITDLVWNHTTLQVRSKDKSWTYLQMLLPLNKEMELINSFRRDMGNKLLWHLEAVSQEGTPRLAALPILKWTNENDLNRIIDKCKDLGALIFNPHSITVEGGGLGVVDSDQVKAKLQYDKKGLLNPGKLEGWETKDNFI